VRPPAGRVPGSGLPARLGALRAAVERAQGRVDEEVLAEARAVVEHAGERLELSANHTVVALGGPTGSGKSSIFNALAGLYLSPAGVRRPTTATTLACIWSPRPTLTGWSCSTSRTTTPPSPRTAWRSTGSSSSSTCSSG
jgi:hypothetical protein